MHKELGSQLRIVRLALVSLFPVFAEEECMVIELVRSDMTYHPVI